MHLFENLQGFGHFVNVIAEACDVEQGLAFVHNRYLGAPDNDAGVWGEDRFGIATVRIIYLAEDIALPDLRTECYGLTQYPALVSTHPVAGVSDEGGDLQLPFLLAPQHTQFTHHIDDALKTGPNGELVVTQCFTGLVQQGRHVEPTGAFAQRAFAQRRVEYHRCTEVLGQDLCLRVSQISPNLRQIGTVNRAGVQVDAVCAASNHLTDE